MQHIETIELLMELVQRKSLTPKDDGCQEIIAQRLEKIGFDITFIPEGKVTNLFALKGQSRPTLGFIGHTDVVPIGQIEDWSHDPFDPIIRNGIMYGRGTSDMKSGIAAMVTAVERFIKKYPEHPESLAFLITSDEEGLAIDGTQKIVEYLERNNIFIDACIVGEPSSTETVGDTIKIGRRGSLTGTLTVNGIQGHVAYPKQADNPIPNLATAINSLSKQVWDTGNQFFPATTFQISNIHGGTGADNVIPAHASLVFNFRFSTEQSEESIKKRVNQLLQQDGINYNIDWGHLDKPFLTQPGNFMLAVKQAINEKTGLTPILSTDGGTSDGRFISPTGCHVIELGVCNHSIHSIDEHVKLEDVYNLTDIYERILEIVQLKLLDVNHIKPVV